MSEHTPHRHEHDPSTNPAEADVTDMDLTLIDPTLIDPALIDPALIDLVAGDPPVPITVWRTARTGADLTATIPARLACRLVAAYSRAGESVVDLTDDHVLTGACAAGERRHHRAWFTDASSLIIGPATPPTPATPVTSTSPEAAADVDGEPHDHPDTALPDTALDDSGEVPELGAWFGDDLTDPHLPPPGEPIVPLPDDGRLEGATSLVVACWPLDDAVAANRVRLAWLLVACARLLRPGGCLVLVVGIPVGMHAKPEDFSPLVAAAANAGLGYLQHIVAVAADTDGDAFVYHLTDEELLTLAHISGQQWTVAHLRVHADLLVLTKAQLPAGSRRLKGSQDEPKGRSGGSSGSLPGGSS
jgi:hypothetical protein